MHSAHGLSWTDDYAWMRAENWREVCAIPSRLPADIRTLLEAENAYADMVLAPTLDLQKSSSAKCARASKRMTASRRKSMGRGRITRGFAPAANAASTAASLARAAPRRC